jgi:hypothetical protein
VGRILKQTIVRIEQLPGEEEEELPLRPSIIQSREWGRRGA